MCGGLSVDSTFEWRVAALPHRVAILLLGVSDCEILSVQIRAQESTVLYRGGAVALHVTYSGGVLPGDTARGAGVCHA